VEPDSLLTTFSDGVRHTPYRLGEPHWVVCWRTPAPHHHAHTPHPTARPSLNVLRLACRQFRFPICRPPQHHMTDCDITMTSDNTGPLTLLLVHCLDERHLVLELLKVGPWDAAFHGVVAYCYSPPTPLPTHMLLVPHSGQFCWIRYYQRADEHRWTNPTPARCSSPPTPTAHHTCFSVGRFNDPSPPGGDDYYLHTCHYLQVGRLPAGLLPGYSSLDTFGDQTDYPRITDTPPATDGYADGANCYRLTSRTPLLRPAGTAGPYPGRHSPPPVWDAAADELRPPHRPLPRHRITWTFYRHHHIPAHTRAGHAWFTTVATPTCTADQALCAFILVDPTGGRAAPHRPPQTDVRV